MNFIHEQLNEITFNPFKSAQRYPLMESFSMFHLLYSILCCKFCMRLHSSQLIYEKLYSTNHWKVYTFFFAQCYVLFFVPRTKLAASLCSTYICNLFQKNVQIVILCIFFSMNCTTCSIKLVNIVIEFLRIR